MPDRLLPRHEVERLTGFKRSAIYERIAAGTFPAPRKDPDSGFVRWRESEVQEWIDGWLARSTVAGNVVGKPSADNKKAA